MCIRDSLSAIDEMDEVMVRQFKDMFDKINDCLLYTSREAFKEQYGFSAPTVQYVYGYRDLMVSKACPVNRLLKDGTKRCV